MLNKIKSLLPSWAAVLSGIGFALASPVWGQEYLVFLSLIPLLWLADQPNKGFLSLAKQGYWVQIIFCILVFFWVPQSFANLWENSWYFNIFLFLTICSLVEFQFIIFIPGVKLIKQKTPWYIQSVLIGFLYAFVDALYPKFFKDTLANAFWEQTNFVSHFNFVYGSYVATFVIVLINILIYHLLKKGQLSRALLVWFFSISVVYFIPQKTWTYSKTVNVFTVSTDFNFKDKKTPGYNHKTFSMILKSLDLIPKGSLVVFPETVYPYDYLNASDIHSEQQNLAFKKIIQERQLNVFIGNVTTLNDKKVNVIILIRKDGTHEFGTKQKLFPFGEYIPFDWIPGFASLFPPTMVDPSPQGNSIFNVDGINYSSAICYESIFTDHVRNLKNQGADVILNISNETWFGYYGEPQLSFAMSIFSSIENNIPLLRSTNGGSGGLVQGHIEDYFLNKDKIIIKNYDLKIP